MSASKATLSNFIIKKNISAKKEELYFAARLFPIAMFST